MIPFLQNLGEAKRISSEESRSAGIWASWGTNSKGAKGNMFRVMEVLP